MIYPSWSQQSLSCYICNRLNNKVKSEWERKSHFLVSLVIVSYMPRMPMWGELEMEGEFQHRGPHLNKGM